MADAVLICNLALGMIGQNPIKSLSDDTHEARTCNIYYQHAVDKVLQSNDWNSAVCHAALPADVSVPIWEYDYQYILPSGVSPEYPLCLRVIKVDGGDDWERRGNKILTNYPPPLNITYIGRVKENLIDPMLAEVIARKLAVDMSVRFTDSAAKTQLLKTLSLTEENEAKRIDARESKPSNIISDNWIKARL